MAVKSKASENEVSTPEVEQADVVQTKSIDMNEKITVKNIAPWNVCWNKIESIGGIDIAPSGSTRIVRAEYVAAFENGNKLICGTGGGNHATVVTDDIVVKKYLENTWENIDKKMIKDIFAIVGIADFEKKIKEKIVTRAEKRLLISIMQECKFNDYNKIRFCENHCNMTVS